LEQYQEKNRAATYKEGSSEDEDGPEDHQPDPPEASKSSSGREGGGPGFGKYLHSTTFGAARRRGYPLYSPKQKVGNPATLTAVGITRITV